MVHLQQKKAIILHNARKERAREKMERVEKEERKAKARAKVVLYQPMSHASSAEATTINKTADKLAKTAVQP